ncbi:MAG: portal protein [Ghiorsea sp.]
MELFGFNFGKQKSSQPDKKLSPALAPPTDNGNNIDTVTFGGGQNSASINFNPSINTDNERINTYRIMSENSDVRHAIDEVVTDAIVFDHNKVVELNMDNTKLSDNIKTKVLDEFNNIMTLIDFRRNADDIFRTWYVDGRVIYQKIFDKSGVIQDIRKMEITKFKKISEVKKEKTKEGVDVIVSSEEYYEYTDETDLTTTQKVKLDPRMIIDISSGLRDYMNNIISYLHFAIKPYNQLSSIEDAVVVYRLARAAEKRVYYVDVGNLAPARASQYMQKIMTSHKSKTVYDAATGSIKDNKHVVSMLEDLYLPRKNGSRGTEVQTLSAGQSLGEMDDVTYFRSKLFKSLKVPSSRMDPDSVAGLGRSSEISRDELKFSKMVAKLRRKFSFLLIDPLKTQLIAKKIITEQDWEEIKEYIYVDFNSDSHFEELKKLEIISNRLDILQNIDSYVGKYFSTEYVKRVILDQSDEDIKLEEKRMKSEPKPTDN